MFKFSVLHRIKISTVSLDHQILKYFLVNFDEPFLVHLLSVINWILVVKSLNAFWKVFSIKLYNLTLGFQIYHRQSSTRAVKCIG